MAKQRISYEQKFLSFSEAKALFKDDGLLDALKEGEVVAYGDYHYSPEQDSPGDRVHINPYCWRHFNIDGDSLFGGMDERGNPDLQGYTNIVIEKSSIEGCKNFSNRGRKEKFDWDSFWRAFAYFLYTSKGEDEDQLLLSLRDWARNAAEDYSYVWENTGAPAETTLEDKVRPLVAAIKQNSDEPLREKAKLGRK